VARRLNDWPEQFQRWSEEQRRARRRPLIAVAIGLLLFWAAVLWLAWRALS
jgi:ferric-dicitrate binding protein FerR (iron transport regulator)